MANRYITTGLRHKYNSARTVTDSQLASATGAQAPGSPNDLYRQKEFFRIAKGQEKGTRTYTQRIRRMNGIVEGMGKDPSVSEATRAFAKDITENYMVEAYNTQKKRHLNKEAREHYANVTLDQILPANEASAPRTQPGQKSLEDVASPLTSIPTSEIAAAADVNAPTSTVGLKANAFASPASGSLESVVSVSLGRVSTSTCVPYVPMAIGENRNEHSPSLGHEGATLVQDAKQMAAANGTAQDPERECQYRTVQDLKAREQQAPFSMTLQPPRPPALGRDMTLEQIREGIHERELASPYLLPNPINGEGRPPVYTRILHEVPASFLSSLDAARSGKQPLWKRALRGAVAGVTGVAIALGMYASADVGNLRPVAQAAAYTQAAPAIKKPEAPPTKNAKKKAEPASLQSIVLSVNDHDPATPDQVYTIQNGKIRDGTGKIVSAIPLNEGDSIVTDMKKSVFRPKPGEVIDIGWRFYGPDGVPYTKDDTRFRRGNTLSTQSPVVVGPLGFAPTASSTADGALFYMAENPKVTESIPVPLKYKPTPQAPAPQATPVVETPTPATETPATVLAPPTGLKAVPTPVVEKSPGAPPAEPIAKMPPVVQNPCPEPPVTAKQPDLTYVQILSGVQRMWVHQDRDVYGSFVDPNRFDNGRFVQFNLAHMTDKTAFDLSFTRGTQTGTAVVNEHRDLDFTREYASAKATVKRNLFGSDSGTHAFGLLGLEANSLHQNMNNSFNFEQFQTKEFTQKGGIGIAKGPWNGTNAYFALTTGVTSEWTKIYENGWEWGNPHTTNFPMRYVWAGAEAGFQLMHDTWMFQLNGFYRQNISNPEKGFSDKRIGVGMNSEKDIKQFGPWTLGVVGAAGVEWLDKDYADPQLKRTDNTNPYIAAGLQFTLGKEKAAKGQTPSSWEASVSTSMGPAQMEFSGEKPNDVDTGSMSGRVNTLEARLAGERAMIEAAGSLTKVTSQGDGRTLSYDETAGTVEGKLAFTSWTIKPMVGARYELRDGRFVVNQSENGDRSFRELLSTTQGGGAGFGFMAGDFTKNYGFASFNVDRMQATSDSRFNLLGWGKPEVTMQHIDWKAWETQVGARIRLFKEKLELAGKGFYSQPFSGIAHDASYGFRVTAGVPIWKGLELEGFGGYTHTPNPFQNKVLWTPENNRVWGATLKWNFGKKK